MKRRMTALLTAGILLMSLLAACGGGGSSAGKEAAEGGETAAGGEAAGGEEMAAGAAVSLPGDWYGTAYEIFVGSFYDSNGDGCGDLEGIRQKLDYIGSAGEDSLGCNEIWLTPICPSPTYHKYDVTDYLSIDPQFGTMEDFDHLLKDCHERGIRVITDLVLNHTSNEHPWFLRAAEYLKEKAGEIDYSEEEGFGAETLSACPELDYYHFTKKAGTGYEALPGTDWYYEARFWSGMPDLNLDSEAVRKEIREIIAFWLGKGVDGFRLDAVTSYYTGSTKENTAFLRWVSETVKQEKPEAYLVGEAWTDQNSYAELYASGIDSLFDFAFAGDSGVIASTVKGSSRAAVYGEAMEAEEALYASYNEDFINAPFYTNHDLARGTGYYAYDDGSRTKLALALNLLQTGNAFLYYGEELGMKGAGKDENKRAPMYWGEAGEEGMTAGPPAMDKVKMKFPSLKEQLSDSSSIFRYVQQAVRLRQDYPLIARGRTRTLPELSGDTVCAFFREDPEGKEKPLLILINFSDAEEQLDLGGQTEISSLAASLLASGGETLFQDGLLTLPPFGIAILE